MRAVSAIASSTRHILGMVLQALLVTAIVAALVIAAATAAGGAPGGADSVFAAKGGNGRGGNAGSVTGGSPSLRLSCDPAPCAVGGALAVTGTDFTPSSGGQQVFLWIGYPDDFCSATACHGFYFNPWVADDGSFSAAFRDALLQAGAGRVSATQYDAQRDRWEQVAAAVYAVQ